MKQINRFIKKVVLNVISDDRALLGTANLQQPNAKAMEILVKTLTEISVHIALLIIVITY